MSKTNDTSKLDHTALEDHHTLADSKLDAVSGGWPEFNYQENGRGSSLVAAGFHFKIEIDGISRGGF